MMLLSSVAGLREDVVAGEPYQKRRKLCHSIQELVVSLSSDCEAEVGLMAEQYERQRKKRRKGEKARSRGRGGDVFRHYSYSSSEPADEDTFAIDEKAMAMATALPELNLFEQDHEEGEGEEEPLMVGPLMDVSDLLERIATAVDNAMGEWEILNPIASHHNEILFLNRCILRSGAQKSD